MILNYFNSFKCFPNYCVRKCCYECSVVDCLCVLIFFSGYQQWNQFAEFATNSSTSGLKMFLLCLTFGNFSSVESGTSWHLISLPCRTLTPNCRTVPSSMFSVISWHWNVTPNKKETRSRWQPTPSRPLIHNINTYATPPILCRRRSYFYLSGELPLQTKY